MKDIRNEHREIVGQVPLEIKEGIGLSFAISNKIDVLMQERGLSKKQLADQLGKRPSEITRWLIADSIILLCPHLQCCRHFSANQ